MGSRFEITVVANDSSQAAEFVALAVTEIRRIETLISSWDSASQTSLINLSAGIGPVKVDPELYDLIERSIRISNLTDGAFDITYAAMDKIWKFDGSMTDLPSPELVAASVKQVGYKRVMMNKTDHSVYLPNKGMKIGFGAIGKGYAADKAKALLIENDVKSGIINASGDMNTWGVQPDGTEWKVAITNPMNKNKVFALLPLYNRAVVTSGNYEKYVIIGGKRYTHIIDPRTGYPVTEVVSATVFAPSAELADALATSVFVMGVEAGIDRVNQLPEIECIMIDNNGKIHISENIKLDSKL